MRSVLLVAIAMGLFACSDKGDGNTTDVATDNGATDEGATDEGATDEGATDEGVTDEGVTDEGVTDEGVTDEGVTDEGQKTTVVIDISAVPISESDLADYKLVTANNSVDATTKAVTVEKDQRDIIGLFDEGGQPLLLGLKHAGEESAELSLASTGVMIVLLTPRFKGVASNDSKELTSRIRAHGLFDELGESIRSAIEYDNPCPLDPACNFDMAELAATIANEIEIDDLYITESNQS